MTYVYIMIYIRNATHIFSDFLAPPEDISLLRRVAPGDILNVIDGKCDDVSQLLAPTVFVKKRLIVTFLTGVAMNPSILCEK